MERQTYSYYKTTGIFNTRNSKITNHASQRRKIDTSNSIQHPLAADSERVYFSSEVVVGRSSPYLKLTLTFPKCPDEVIDSGHR
jgi:hypothetical protein